MLLLLDTSTSSGCTSGYTTNVTYPIAVHNLVTAARGASFYPAWGGGWLLNFAGYALIAYG